MLHVGLRRKQRGGSCLGEARPRARRQPDCGGASVAGGFSLLPFDLRSWPPALGRDLSILKAIDIKQTQGAPGAHVKLSLVIASATRPGRPAGHAWGNRGLVAIAIDRIKAQFRRKFIEPSSSLLRSSRVQVSGDFFPPRKSIIVRVGQTGKLLREGDGRFSLDHFGRSSCWELSFVGIVEFPVWIAHHFVHLYSSKRVGKPSIARGQHCAPGQV